MSDIVNIFAEADRNIVGDDSSPTLTLENTSTGKGLKVIGISTSNPTAEILVKSGAAPTISALRLGASEASGSAFSFVGSCIISTASGGATLMAAVRVKYGDKYGWMRIFENIA